MDNENSPEDLHDQLVKAYLNYFRENEKWEQRDSVRQYYAVQVHVKKIKKLARLRELEIRKIHVEKQDQARQKKLKKRRLKNSTR